MSNQVKIIAGEWRGRNLTFPTAKGLRPTPARVRETLFNWLQYDVLGSRCLDLYSGSGALGLEAASRGAKEVVQVENNAQVCQQLKVNTVILSATMIKIVQNDVFRYLSGEVQTFNLVFLDPPFGKGLAMQSLHCLEDKGWLAVGAKIYIEVETQLDLKAAPENWILLKSKQAGAVSYCLFERGSVLKA
jgi:16S rRNA (guanine966-N2)-methyltransferase